MTSDGKELTPVEQVFKHAEDIAARASRIEAVVARLVNSDKDFREKILEAQTLLEESVQGLQRLASFLQGMQVGQTTRLNEHAARIAELERAVSALEQRPPKV